MSVTIILANACTKVDQNVGTWGSCILENWFMNSEVLMAMMLYFFFAIIMYRIRAPVQIIVSSFMILSFILAQATNSPILNLIFLISLIPLAGAVFLAILRRFLR